MSATPTDDEIATAYGRALAYADRQSRGRGGDLAEALRDAATDGVVRARDTYDPTRSTAGFGPFCCQVVKTRVRRAQRTFSQRRRVGPQFAPLPDDCPARDLPAAGAVPMTPELADLPDELREPVELVYVHGYTLREAADRLGVHHDTVSERLRKAAFALAPDGATRPKRRPGEKRVRGGKGH